MRTLRIFSLILVIALLAVPSGISAQDAELTPAQEYRGFVMSGLDAHNGAIRALVGGDVEQPGHVLDHAIALQGLADMLGDVFPEGSGEGTRAMAEVWQDWDGFMEKVSALQSASGALVEAARSGDEAAIGEAARGVGMSCRSCHQGFRARRN